MSDKELLPFDLEVALKEPERVVCRNGEKPSELYYFKTSKSDYPVTAVVNKLIYVFTVKGEYLNDEEYKYDLFLLPKKITLWMVVCKEKYDSRYETVIRDSLDAMKHFRTNDMWEIVSDIFSVEVEI